MIHHPLHLVSLLVDPKVAHESALWLPLWFTYSAAYVAEKVAWLCNVRLPVQPTHLGAMLGGISYFDGLRAALTLDYSPPYDEREAVQRTKKYFDRDIDDDFWNN
jgi:hypothetical protein